MFKCLWDIATLSAQEPWIVSVSTKKCRPYIRTNSLCRSFKQISRDIPAKGIYIREDRAVIIKLGQRCKVFENVSMSPQNERTNWWVPRDDLRIAVRHHFLHMLRFRHCNPYGSGLHRSARWTRGVWVFWDTGWASIGVWFLDMNVWSEGTDQFGWLHKTGTSLLSVFCQSGYVLLYMKDGNTQVIPWQIQVTVFKIRWVTQELLIDHDILPWSTRSIRFTYGHGATSRGLTLHRPVHCLLFKRWRTDHIYVGRAKCSRKLHHLLHVSTWGTYEGQLLQLLWSRYD